MTLNECIAKSKGYKCYQMKRSGFDLQYVYPPNEFPWDNRKDKEQFKAECVEIDIMKIDYGCLDGHGLPDWEHDPRLYMALFEEMAKSKSTIHDNSLYVDLYARDENVFQVYVSHGCMCHEEVTESDTIGTAICLAYCKLYGLECDHE